MGNISSSSNTSAGRHVDTRRKWISSTDWIACASDAGAGCTLVCTPARPIVVVIAPPDALLLHQQSTAEGGNHET